MDVKIGRCQDEKVACGDLKIRGCEDDMCRCKDEKMICVDV